ncbi:MAG TPA: SpoIIE family protein phosphatase, partial [Planctomycetota bacterium]|nr:SpoIIE family protein phosphatase [Planctomycetota bacterium]
MSHSLEPDRGAAPARFLVLSSDPELTARIADLLHESGDALTIATDRSFSSVEEGPWDGALVDLRFDPRLLRRVALEVPWVIAGSSSDDPYEIIQAVRQGARDYVLLPPAADALDDVLERWRRARSPTSGFLEYRDEAGRPARFPLPARGSVRIGRERDNEISFASQVVSRYHARIDAESAPGESESIFWLIDCGSRHGLFVNDTPTKSPRIELRDGDRIRLGKPSAPTLVFRAHRTGDPTRDLHDESLAAAFGSTAIHDADRELREVAALLDTFLRVNDHLVLDEVVSLVLERSIQFAGAERGLILLADDVIDGRAEELENGSPPELRPALALDRHARPLPADSLAISRRIPEQVVTTGEGILIRDLLESSDAGAHLLTIDLGVRSAICVPLKARLPSAGQGESPRPIGVLYVDSALRAQPFSDHLLHALESLANEAAQAIVNAKLWAEAQQKKQIDEEMRLAQEIQENLLPPSRFECEWVELTGSSIPSRAVGGDIFNYHAWHGRRLSLLVGDVSGKGVGAAIFSALLDGHFLSLGSLADPERELGAQFEELNLYLIEKSRGQKFVSFVFGLLHDDGRLVYVNAGHHPPLHVRRDGTISRLGAGGTIMGLLEESRYEVGTAHLEPGDGLVLYS